MFTKKLIVAFAIFGATASVQAALQEKIATRTEKIDALKKDIKEGKFVNANKGCRTQGCNKCNKCRSC